MSNFPLIKELEDDQYPYDYIDHQRIIARGIILNENNEVALIYIKGKDIFGERDYYETPGGGVNDGEDLYEGVLREVEEETGFKCEVIKELGYVKDYYNLIHRENLSYYFLLRFVSKGDTHLEFYEQEMFKGVYWFKLDDAIKVMNKKGTSGVAKLVKEREVPILKLSKLFI